MATKEKPAPKKKRVAAKPVQQKDENASVRNWRQEQIVKSLRRAGMTDEQIDLNVIKTLVDRADFHHALQTLIDKGCPPETALRILA